MKYPYTVDIMNFEKGEGMNYVSETPFKANFREESIIITNNSEFRAIVPKDMIVVINKEVEEEKEND